MKITVDEVVYDVVKEKEITDCRGCFLCGFTNGQTECFEITNVDCIKEKVIFLKVPDSFKNCYNCNFYNEYDCSECKNYDKWEAKE